MRAYTHIVHLYKTTPLQVDPAGDGLAPMLSFKKTPSFKHSNMRESNVRESNIRNAFGARRGSDRQSSARTSGERETHAGK